MQCAYCKNKIKNNVKFCPECGQKVIVVQEIQELQEVPLVMKVGEVIGLLRTSRTMFYKLLALENDPIPFFPLGSDKRFITSEVLEWAKRNQTTLIDKKIAYLDKTG